MLVVICQLTVVDVCSAPENDRCLENATHSEEIFNKTIEYSMYNDFIEPLTLVEPSGCRQISFIELYLFLLNDTSDIHEYIEIEHDCTQFAESLVNNASKRGYDAKFVYIKTSKSAHAVVGFNTSNAGWVFVDNTQPMRDIDVMIPADYFVNLNFGENITIDNIRMHETLEYDIGVVEEIMMVK